ncbi:MAG: peptide MFS transporter [Bryobacteraceae bacterium]|jgi:POT family proton-dependent oligopeptide transporter
MASSPDLNVSFKPPHSDRTFFGHPRGLATLFFTEMWERFSYYGMRALLILFMTAGVERGGLGFPVAKAAAIYGLYTAMVYLLSLPGGWVADRIIGQRKAVLYGGVLIACGQFCLMAPGTAVFYLGLVILVLGAGLLKPNVSAIVGQLYAQGDGRRDAGFSIFYMGINLGALISPLACGWVGERISWRLGFGLAGVGMIAGLIQYVAGAKYFGDAGLRPRGAGSPEEARTQKRRAAYAALAALGLAGVLGALTAAGRIDLTAQTISNALGVALAIVTATAFSWLLAGKGWSPVERKRSAAILVLFLSAAVFWSAFEQAGSSLNLFAERNTARNVLGFLFPASWFQFVQPLFIVALAPVFAWLWVALRGREPSSPAKFAWGLFFAGLGFAILVPASSLAMKGALVSSWWLVFTYLFHSLGELCLSPVGLSAMTKLAPARVAGMMMGLWFVTIAIGDYLGARVASLYESVPLPTLFGIVAGVAFVAALALIVLVKPTVRLMSGVK